MLGGARTRRRGGGFPHAAGRTASAPDPVRSSVPIPWRSPLAWQVTLYMGLQSSGFYVMIAWLPGILESRGSTSGAAGWALFGYQVAGLAASFLLPLLTRRLGDQRAVAVGSAVGVLIGFTGLAIAPGLLALWVVVTGLGGGACLVTALTLIGLRAPDAAHTTALSGMAQSVGYLLVLAVATLALAVTGLGAGRDRHIGTRAVTAPPPSPHDDRRPVLHGVVRDPDGAPVTGAVLTLTDDSGHQVASDTTGASGRYRLTVTARGDHL